MYEGQKCIIRCARAGVFFAEVESLDGNKAQLKNARRLWYWDGAASLSQMAVEGVKAPENCKFTVTVPTMTVIEVIEVIPCTPQAAACIESVAEWKR